MLDASDGPFCTGSPLGEQVYVITDKRFYGSQHRRAEKPKRLLHPERMDENTWNDSLAELR